MAKTSMKMAKKIAAAKNAARLSKSGGIDNVNIS